MGDSVPAKVFYEGCPGCAVERRKETREGVPYKELLFVAVITLAAGTYPSSSPTICYRSYSTQLRFGYSAFSSATSLLYNILLLLQ